MVRIDAAQSDLPPCIQGQISSSVMASSKQAVKNRAFPSVPSRASAVGDIALNSSWIKRLKSRDESEVMRRSCMEVVPELLKTSDEEGSSKPLCLLQEKLAMSHWTSNIDLATPDRQTVQKCYGASSQNLTTRKERTGFGPWSRSSSRRLDGKQLVVQGSTHFNRMPAIDNFGSLGSSNPGTQVEEMAKTSFASSNSPHGEASTPSNNNKPLLPHLSSRPPRPETGKFEGLSFSLGNSLHPSERKDAACDTGPTLQTQVTSSSKVTPVIQVIGEEEAKTKMVSTAMDVRNAFGTHVILTLPKNGASKLTDGQNVTQNASKGHRINSLEELLLENSVGNAGSQRPSGGGLESPQSSSSTASFPFEMFVEAAGASNVTMEQFAQAYNRARVEPDSQRTFHCIERDAEKNIDEELPSGPSGCNPDLSPEMQHLEDHMWSKMSQGRFATFNVGSRHKAFDINGEPLHVPPRTIEWFRSKQHASSFVAGKREEVIQNIEVSAEQPWLDWALRKPGDLLVLSANQVYHTLVAAKDWLPVKANVVWGLRNLPLGGDLLCFGVGAPNYCIRGRCSSGIVSWWLAYSGSGVEVHVFTLAGGGGLFCYAAPIALWGHVVRVRGLVLWKLGSLGSARVLEHEEIDM